ncbi:CgeB family protein [Sediminibacillus albus]|uniref:Spore maturation protein CgeB n=1 Tax=Sediminibacillus albus TaxID=407036 RepID=A0A1G8ZF65_9BACI|nr:glycosyltransferase [Sediminibacillus albus]SDK13756.1 Spore maturation protein CgeB [Sediminibacillus albus]
MTINIKQRLKAIQEKRSWINKRNPGILYSELSHGSHWYKNTKYNIHYNEKNNYIDVDIPSNEHSYLNYLEKSSNFDEIPNHSVTYKAGNKDNLVVFEGNKTGDLIVELFIIGYSRNGRIETYSVPLNDRREITFPEKVEKLRLALRLKGRGKFKIDNLCLNNNKLWLINDEKAYGKYYPLDFYGWYAPKTPELIYNKEDNLFQANFDVHSNFSYLVYDEPNTNFETIYGNGIPITEDTLSVYFNGQKSENVEIKLVIILYSGNKKQTRFEVELNERKLLKMHEEFDHMRLALRVSGSGTFNVEEIIINNEIYWWGQELPQSKKHIEIECQKSYRLTNETLIGWKRQDDKINYSFKYDIFHSKLKGNQFVHLTCINENNTEFITPEKGMSYTIHPTGEIYRDTKVSLLVIGIREGTSKIIGEVPFNEGVDFVFEKNINSIMFLVRVMGQGLYKNLEINIDEKPIEVTNSMKLDLSNIVWHPTSKKNIKLTSENNSLAGNINIPDGKHLYIAYKENNTSFGKLPTTLLMSVQKGYEYEFSVQSQANDGVNLLPMFIGYSNNKKIQVLQLKPNSSTKIKPLPEVTQFRIALRVAGQGDFKINEFSIKETESVKNDKTIKYVDKYEVDKLDLLPAKPLNNLKMAVIFDEFTYACYKHECNLITFTPDNWLEVLTSEEPDLLMIESAWNGNGGAWNKKVGDYGEENMKPLNSLVEWCKEKNIPTVFWNKEDPVHYNRFIKTAKKFDYIYTTDENMIEFYQESVGHSNVYVLPFAAQPLIHNPIKIVNKRERKACFAGSYYRHHTERSVDMDRLLDSASKYGLDIYDRNYLMTKKGLMPNHQFPERLQPYIKGNLKYYEIDKAYKGYQVMINVNTVKDSPTMFSRRVFEGLACGTPVISTYAKGVQNFFGDLVEMKEDSEELDKSFRNILEDEAFYNKKSITGIREVLTKHTYTNRISSIVNNAKLNFDYQYPQVSVIAFAATKQEYEQIINQYERQNYANKKLLLLVDTFEGYLELFNTHNDNRVQTFIRSYMHNYNNILEWIDTPYVAFFSNKDYYGRNYLNDLMLSTLYTDSDFIGKSNYFTVNKRGIIEMNNGEDYTFVSTLSPSRCVAKTSSFSSDSLERILMKFSSGEDLSEYFRFGNRFYSGDKFNYLEGGNKESPGENLGNEIEAYIEI